MSTNSKRIKIRGVLEGPFGTAEPPQMRLGRPTVRRRRHRHDRVKGQEKRFDDQARHGLGAQRGAVEVSEGKEGVDRPARAGPAGQMERTERFSFKGIKLRGMLGDALDRTEPVQVRFGRPTVRRVHPAHGAAKPEPMGADLAGAAKEKLAAKAEGQRTEGSGWLALVTFVVVLVFGALLLAKVDWRNLKLSDPHGISEQYPSRH